MMRELSFGARITDSFVKKLKWETAQASDESRDALLCLCVEERQHKHCCDHKEEKAIDVEPGAEIPAVNRLVPPTPSRFVFIKQRAWVLRSKEQRPAANVIFQIDNVQLHIPEQTQAELKGSIVDVQDDRIVVVSEPI